MPMDLKNQRRAEIEDERTGPIGELVNRLLGSPRGALHGLATHPFMTDAEYKAMLYEEALKRNPPDYGSPLAVAAGEKDIEGSGKKPIPYHPMGLQEPQLSILERIIRGEL